MADGTLLVRVSGPDRPGLTADLMDVLAGLGADIQDVEQVLLRGQLTLAAVVALADQREARKELLLFGDEMSVRVEVTAVPPVSTAPERFDVVTMLAPLITPEVFGDVAATIARVGGNIDRIVRLSRYPVVSYELRVAGADPVQLRREIAATGADAAIDLAVQEEGLGRRAKRLVAMDIDSTLIQDEMIDLLAEAAGCGPKVAEITDRAMAGELDFEEALRERVGLLAGQPVSILDEVSERIRLTPGARTFTRTLRRLGYSLVAISGGFQTIADSLADTLGLHEAHANILEVVDGRLTGRVVGPVVDRERKAELLVRAAEEHGVPLEQTVAIGDGANDVDMLAVAGLGIAFNARAVVQNAADTSISVPYLDAILFLLGVKRTEIEREELTDPDPPPVPLPDTQE